MNRQERKPTSKIISVYYHLSAPYSTPPTTTRGRDETSCQKEGRGSLLYKQKKKERGKERIRITQIIYCPSNIIFKAGREEKKTGGISECLRKGVRGNGAAGHSR